MTHQSKFTTFLEKNLPFKMKPTNQILYSMFICEVSQILQIEKIS